MSLRCTLARHLPRAISTALGNFVGGRIASRYLQDLCVGVARVAAKAWNLCLRHDPLLVLLATRLRCHVPLQRCGGPTTPEVAASGATLRSPLRRR
jgi:hypothetical protein